MLTWFSRLGKEVPTTVTYHKSLAPFKCFLLVLLAQKHCLYKAQKVAPLTMQSKKSSPQRLPPYVLRGHTMVVCFEWFRLLLLS